MDQEVGKLLEQLHTDQLRDETIVFFYGDNGMGMPRGERCLWDTGLQEPLLIRFPDRFRGQSPDAPGSRTDRLVSFVDFAPTVLSLSGVRLPAHMQGVPILGDAAGLPRERVFGARDRVDEAFGLSRSVRDWRSRWTTGWLEREPSGRRRLSSRTRTQRSETSSTRRVLACPPWSRTTG